MRIEEALDLKTAQPTNLKIEDVKGLEQSKQIKEVAVPRPEFKRPLLSEKHPPMFIGKNGKEYGAMEELQQANERWYADRSLEKH